MRLRGALALLFLCACDARGAEPERRSAPREAGESVSATAPKPVGFLKGQLHMHTNGSGDSETPAERAAAWYAEHDYDFIVFTDHNTVTDTPDLPNMLTIRGMEVSQNLRTCEPAPPPGTLCLLHVSALFLGIEPGRYRIGREGSLARVELYRNAVELTRSWGGIAMLNHPNFRDAADIDVVMGMVDAGTFLMEVENRAVDSDNEGRAGRMSTEQLWDEALARGARIFGTATDDAHHYDDVASVRASGQIAYVGERGWVMVRAERNEGSIRTAIERGDFYATTGLILEVVDLSAERLHVEVAGGEAVTFEVIGKGGGIVHRALGATLDYSVPLDASGYVRVRASDSRGRRALCQPVFLAR